MTLLEELIQYSNDVIGGVIIACEKHKWACGRFLNDLERQGTDDFPFVFDEAKADLFLSWLGLFKHRKGVLQGELIKPVLIQKFVFGNIYGWVHKDTGYRRFSKAYWQVGRKNAKSQSLGAVGTYEAIALGEGSSEVYCAATKREQAKIVWLEAEAMLNSCDLLKGKYKIAYSTITHLKSGSFMKSLSKEDSKGCEGSNPQCGIIDEYHLHETSEMYNMIDSGMVARPQPLLVIITTAGSNLSVPCYRVEYDLISKILNPSIDFNSDSYFCMVNELDKEDDIKDEKNWEKANPILYSYEEGRDRLRKRLILALEAPEKMKDFMTKSMNIWVQQRDCGYMDMAKWKACGVKELPNVKGLEVTAGVDLSATIDLTSVGFEIRVRDKIVIMSHSFMPEDTVAKKIKADKIPYDLWIKQGWITSTPGAEVDYEIVLDYIDEIYKKNDWQKTEVCFDRALATWFKQQLEKRDYTPIEIAQGMYSLSAGTKDFRAKTYNGLMIHDNNPVLGWALSNAVTRSDGNDNIMLDKSKAKERIDPAASLMNSHARVMIKDKVLGVYENRGMRSLL